MTTLGAVRAVRPRGKGPGAGQHHGVRRDAAVHVDELRRAGVGLVLYPLSAFRDRCRALRVYEAIRKDGTQRGVMDLVQTRDDLYRCFDYHGLEGKLDELFDRKGK